MKEIKIKEVSNGYHAMVIGSDGIQLQYVFKSTEEFQMLEFIGKLITTKKVIVRAG